MNLADKETQLLLERICATAIANHAILKCAFARRPMTVESVLTFVDDFFEPSNEDLGNVAVLIEDAISSVVETGNLRRSASAPANNN